MPYCRSAKAQGGKSLTGLCGCAAPWSPHQGWIQRLLPENALPVVTQVKILKLQLEGETRNDKAPIFFFFFSQKSYPDRIAGLFLFYSCLSITRKVVLRCEIWIFLEYNWADTPQSITDGHACLRGRRYPKSVGFTLNIQRSATVSLILPICIAQLNNS